MQSTSAAADYLKALADTEVEWAPSDPGEPDSFSGPGSPPSPALVFLTDDALAPSAMASPHTDFLADSDLCQTQDITRYVPFSQQGHNHSEEEMKLCLDSYRQRVTTANGTRMIREFDPLDYPPGQAPTESVLEPCPAAFAERYETIVESNDVARRLAACWNALRGIPTEALEKYSESIAVLMDAWVDCKLYRERMDSLAAKTEPDASPVSQP